MSERRANFILAPPLVLVGLFFIVLPFGFATMGDGRPKARGWGEYLLEVLKWMPCPLSIGIPLIALGIYVGAHGVADPEERRRK